MFVTEYLLCGGPLGDGQKHTYRLKELGLRYDALVESGADVSHWDRLSKEHDSKWPFIRQELIDALEAQVCRSYKQLSTYVNGWCSARTIERWLNSHPSFEVYGKNIKPGLTEVMRLYSCIHVTIHLSLMFLFFFLPQVNKGKQVEFSMRVVEFRWGLAPTIKVLWIMSDEKWFHALVPR